MIKALLIFGGAIIVFSCGQKSSGVMKDAKPKSRILTESSRNLTIAMSENGEPSYIFTAPLVEGYTLGNEPYREFREGVEIITFSEDSIKTESGRLKAKYAIYYEKTKIWEAIGDVEVRNTEGRELYSQQLFWNANTKLIYSNVETKIVDTKNGDVYIGEGFESDEEMNDWSFRKLTGRMSMELNAAEEGENDDTPASEINSTNSSSENNIR